MNYMEVWEFILFCCQHTEDTFRYILHKIDTHAEGYSIYTQILARRSGSSNRSMTVTHRTTEIRYSTMC